jgi:hypothetical protein
MKSKSLKLKEPVKIKEVVKEALDKAKILQENQPKEDRFTTLNKIDNELKKLWSEFTSGFDFDKIETQLTFTI